MLESYKVINFRTKEAGVLIPVLKIDTIDRNDILQIKRIFNSPDVYNNLFSRTLKGKKFTINKIKGYLDWSVKQTINGENITYFIRDRDDLIRGSVDMQKVDANTVTVGYWADPEAPGFITNSVTKIVRLARRLGYKIIDAYPEEGNIKSIKVLERAGFMFIKKISKSEKVLLKYVIS